ncbi:TonB-dependent receptor [Marinimicrobium sp. C6131]|uniref:TonB-dependent receptor n=1 Tax=Marinimicrobium sp. C6131 TaxID=3022676 RepID=UPI00223D18CA|nr:TonB-dependent receptor [Marinimicrobium sp. C6131]UZJ42826.1 TonB-dependent receptor [Marinimicrobium sp. C6131]
MKNTPQFKKSLLALTVAATSAASGAYAQDDTAQAQPMEEVVVTGIRAALMQAQAVKMESSSVVEALSAEDIGKLPDSSIAESLARLPGLAGERSGGRTSGISVRGFKEDFTGTTLNGRELIGIGDNRGVEYDLYPSEIMTGAVVYKSADAELITQGIGGTVDLQTVRPLDADETFTLNYTLEQTGRESDNPEFDDQGHRYAMSIVDQFADDTLGVAFTYADTESPTNQRKYGVWGYNDDGDGNFLPSGLDTQAISKELARETISTIVQFSPNESLDIVVDYLSIDFEDAGIIRGFIEPFSADPSSLSGSGLNVSGTQIGANPVLRTDPENIVGELDTYGVNATFALTDNWSATVDIAHSESEKLYERAESYSGLGRSGSLTSDDLGSREFQMSPDGVTFTSISGMDFSDWDAIKLTGPQQWGGGMAAVADTFDSNVLRADGNPYTFLDAQDGFWNHADFAEELDTFKFQLDGDVDWSIFSQITAGIAYSDRMKRKDNHGDFATADTYPFGDGSGPVDDVVPESYRYGLADLTWAGLGEVIAYDGFTPYRDGTYFLTPADYLEPDRLGDTFIVEEEVTTLFVKADFETDLAGMEAYGNVGVQVIDTDQSSSGYIGIVDETLTTCLADGSTPYDPVVDSACEVQGGASYTNVLPSLNFNLAVTHSDILRLAASKTISRSRIDFMKASGFVKFDQNIDLIEEYMVNGIDTGSPWSKSQGNPELRPLESNNFDLSYERYFSDDGYFALTYFYKDLVNWTDNSGQTIDFSNDVTNDGANYYIPGFHDRTVTTPGGQTINGRFYPQGSEIIPFHEGEALGDFASYEDGLEGSLDGFEFTANVPLRELSPALEGFGIAGSATILDGGFDNGASITGQSDESYSLTVFYEVGGFEFRVAGTKRGDYETYQRGGSNKIETVTRNAVSIVDAQISYDFAGSGVSALDGLRVSLQGTNLTDQGDESVDENGIVNLSRDFGPVYMLNLNYSLY